MISVIDTELETARGLACIWFGVDADALTFELSCQNGGGWVVSARPNGAGSRDAVEAYGYGYASEAVEAFVTQLEFDIAVRDGKEVRDATP